MKTKALLTGLLLGLLAVARPGRAQEVGPSEYQVKAAFLYNFAKFVKWPDKSFASTNSPLVIGILGDNPFGTDLEVAVKNKTINGHPLLIKQVAPAELKSCHVVFISRTPKRNLPETLEPLKRESILTVSEVEEFTGAGGMICFTMEENKVRFEINDAAAKMAGLSISSKLLNLAKKPEAKG